MVAEGWNVILGATTVIGFGLAIWQAVRAEQLNRRERDLDWPRFRSTTSDLARSIDRSDFMPEVILALSERGAMVAHLVARELRRQVPIVTVAYLGRPDGNADIPGYEAIHGTKAVLFLPERIGELQGRRLLLLDDFVMSGDGLHATIAALLGKGFDRQDIRSGAVVATKLSIVSKKGPDYFGREARNFDFYFPWGRAE
ncbi:phosphoribosyltransferase [Micromonospora sp. LH3U1]|uniref:phosphoribosyltransferase n=1 Tax=Micromonospora sp. LH3U1 TaxID=3018339 RepID=UPI00234BB677|nr:phosphoribosyltransferase family protein [Micromonospora sp. LH3U1]WCN83810.1 phosphoribosyltransferase family protein [Micromonospora sp. LH3U1]